jgi:hypothetical protein
MFVELTAKGRDNKAKKSLADQDKNVSLQGQEGQADPLRKDWRETRCGGSNL